MTRTNGKTGVARTLARPGDPYVDIKGQVYHPLGSEEKIKSDQFKVDAKKFKTNRKRSLKELPALPAVMKGVSCVLTFTLLGLGDRDIAEGLGISVEEVKAIRKMPSYSESFDLVSAAFIDANSDFIHARLAGFSNECLTQLATIAVAGKKEENRMRASADILDRAGYTAKAGQNKSSDGGNELRIVISDGDRNVEVSVNGGV